MITIDEYKNADKKLEELTKKHTKIEGEQAEESNKIWIKYNDLETELSEKKRKAQETIRKKYERKTEIIHKQAEPHAKIRNQYTKIMNMMDIHKNHYPTDFTVYKYDYPRDKNGEILRTKEEQHPDKQKIHYTPIDTIKNDKYAKIQAFIVENDKPKNRFSLLIIGNTIFTEKIIKLPYGYGYPCRVDGDNIIYLIKDLPTKEELQKYYKRNKTKILQKDFLKQLPQIEKEYENVLKNTDNNGWELAYWESQKEDYEQHYSHGTETKEYQEVLKQIKEIKERNENGIE